MKRRVRRNSSAETAPLARNEYTALHEGAQPRGTVLEHIEPFVGPKNILGRLTEIQYRKRVTDGTYSYHHPFADRAQPTVFVDAAGKIGLYRGRYKTTYRGIEDRTRGEIEDERLPGRASRLITLGKVEFFRYKWEDENGDVQTEEIRFTDGTAPTLSHDQRGDLRFTGGSPLKEHTTMKTKGKSRARRNPSGKSGDMMTRGKRILVTGLAVGTGVALTMVGMQMLFSRYTWSPVTKAGIAAGVGLVGALAAGAVLPGVPAVAASIAVGGMATAGLQLWATYVAPRLSRSAAFPRNAGFPAELTAGRAPAGFSVREGAACGT